MTQFFASKKYGQKEDFLQLSDNGVQIAIVDLCMDIHSNSNSSLVPIN